MGRKSHGEVFWAAHPEIKRCEDSYQSGKPCRFEPLPGDAVCVRHRELRDRAKVSS